MVRGISQGQMVQVYVSGEFHKELDWEYMR